jgi:hypothetical protein
MQYVIETRDGEKPWEPFTEPTLGFAILGKGTQQLNQVQRIYRTEKEAEDRVGELERRLPRKSPLAYRAVGLQRPNLETPEFEWARDGAPTAETIAAKKAELDERLIALEAEKAKLTEESNQLLGYTLVTCTRNCHGPGCGKATPIRELVYIQTHWYVEPHGCTGGDYWRAGEGNFDCPHCGHRNRLYDRKPIEALRHLFRGVTNEHRDR